MKAMLLALSIMSVGANASQCNLDINAQINLTKENLKIVTEDNDTILISSNSPLKVNDKVVSLSASQQTDVTAYHYGLYDTVPNALNLASDAVSIAKDAITLSLGQLLGEDDALVTSLNTRLNDISVELNRKVYADDGSVNVSLNTHDGHFFGEEWENKLEEEVEYAVKKSVGKLLMAIGSELIFNNGDTSEWEQKFENLGHNIETHIEDKAENLEYKAEALCEQLKALDDVENRLQESVPELASLNLFDVNPYDDSEYRK